MGKGVGGGAVNGMVVVVSPPVLPGLFRVGEGGAGDEMESAVNPAACSVFDGIVIEEIEKIGDGGQALLVGQHAGEREAESGALTDASRRVVSEAIEEGVDGVLVAEHCKALVGPITRVFIGVA